jgi:hypothetical protein
MREEGSTGTLRFRVAEHGSVFSTRGRARDAREQLLTQLSGEQTIELDFDGVRSFSYSFADEFLGKLLSELDASVQVVRVLHAPSALQASLSATAERRCQARRLEFDGAVP